MEGLTDTLLARGDAENGNEDSSQKQNDREKKKTEAVAGTKTGARGVVGSESEPAASNAAVGRRVAAKVLGKKQAAAKVSVKRQAALKAAPMQTGLGDAKEQVKVVRKLLKKVEEKLSGKDVKASLGDYFPSDGLGTSFSGMPFYDAWNVANFLALYGHALATITTNTVNPASYPDEVSYLPGVIGDFTSAIMTHVRTTQAGCRFEVLYPTDVNQTAFNRAINYPASWTPSALTVLKTESFGFTLGRDLERSKQTMEFGVPLGFPASQRSHLVGIEDATAPWMKEARMAAGMRFESVVLFALDQFCLIGYPAPLPRGFRRSIRVGN